MSRKCRSTTSNRRSTSTGSISVVIPRKARLAALVERPPGLDRWQGPYLKQKGVPADPWGHPYRYRIPGEHGEYDLYSLGADDAPGGTGENQDITNWQ